jgi:benzoyl-CoA 2,3-dioxygenase component B
VWQEVPGEHRNALQRIIVTQADTEPASVEQQRWLGKTAPSLLRPAQPVPGERRGGPPPVGDGLPAPRHFGRDGRDEAEALLERRSGDPTSPASSTPSTSPAPTG